jgi:hypothetical protein
LSLHKNMSDRNNSKRRSNLVLKGRVMGRSVKERMETDPVFRSIVFSMLSMFEMTGEGITPTEVREAMGLAWQIYCERNMRPTLVVRYPDDGH